MNEYSANIYIAKYTASQVSKYIVEEMNRSGISITDLRVVRLLYLIQAYYFKTYGRPLFINEIYVTGYGIDIRYAIGKNSGCRAMRVKASYFTDEEDIDDDDKENIDKVLVRFKNYGDHDLADLIMKQAPWKEARSMMVRSGGFDDIITKKSLYDHYHKKHKRTEKEFKDRPRKSESKPKRYRIKPSVVRNFFAACTMMTCIVLGFRIDMWICQNARFLLVAIHLISKITCFIFIICELDGNAKTYEEAFSNLEKKLRSCVFEEID